MDFTEEQRNRIDALLAEGEETNKAMGNKKFSHEEVWKPIFDLIEDMKKKEKEYVRD